MRKRTIIHTQTFVWAALVILFLSSTIGTTVWAKPAKPPGKPEPPPPETATFRISIGDDGEDVVLREPKLFDVVTSVEGWYPAGKGKPRWGSWGIPFLEDRCGYYTMQPIYSDENATYLTDLYHGEVAQLIGLEHYWDRYKDFWRIGINWTSDIKGNGELEPLILNGWTDRGPEPEGSYDSANDVWTLTFTTTNAYFVVGWCDGSTCWVDWCGYLKFTITIEKIPSN